VELAYIRDVQKRRYEEVVRRYMVDILEALPPGVRVEVDIWVGAVQLEAERIDNCPVREYGTAGEEEDMRLVCNVPCSLSGI
jgi:hypothetical protein